MTTPKTIAGIAASLLVFSGVAACSPQDRPATPAGPAPATTAPATGTRATETQAPGQATTPAGSSRTQDAEARNAGALQALSTAADAASGTPYEIDGADDDRVWEVKVLAGERKHEVKVSRDGRSVVGQEQDEADAEDVRRLQGAGLALGQAIERALSEAPGSLKDAELDDDTGVAVWKVEIDTPGKQGVKVLIKVADGQVVRVER